MYTLLNSKIGNNITEILITLLVFITDTPQVNAIADATPPVRMLRTLIKLNVG
jgi:hypothetical protein